MSGINNARMIDKYLNYKRQVFEIRFRKNIVEV